MREWKDITINDLISMSDNEIAEVSDQRFSVKDIFVIAEVYFKHIEPLQQRVQILEQALKKNNIVI